VPTGFRFAGASRDFDPMYGSNMCFGISMPRVPQKASAQNGVGFMKFTRTVCASILSTRRSW
jgi:hypothetical protein